MTPVAAGSPPRARPPARWPQRTPMTEDACAERLSSEPDRYRGRRRVPTPPRARYAAVVTSAFVGAGIVALGAGATLPDAKTVSPNALSDLENASAASDLAERSEDAARSSRDDERGLTTSMNQQKPDVWLLPVRNYRYTSPYGMRWGKLHAGVDLARAGDRAGRPLRHGHARPVVRRIRQRRHPRPRQWHRDRVRAPLAPSGPGRSARRGRRPIGLAGNTGHSYGSHSHFEVHVNGVPRDPIRWMRAKGVDIKIEVEAIYGGVID